MSLVPPGGYGMTSETGRLGQLAASGAPAPRPPGKDHAEWHADLDSGVRLLGLHPGAARYYKEAGLLK